MSFWFFIVIVIVSWWIYVWYNDNRPEKKIESFEKLSDMFWNSLETNARVMYGQDEVDKEILLMKDWYVRLREKYKHNTEQLIKIAEDWKDYTYNQSHSQSNKYLWFEAEVNSEDYRQDEIRESTFKIEELENRFAHLLGMEYEKQLKDLREQKERKAKEFWGEEKPKKHKK